MALRSRSRSHLLAFAVAVLFAVTARADQPDAAFRESVRELMRLTGSSQLGTQMANGVFESVIAAMRRSNPDLPPRVETIVREVATETFGSLFNDEERVLDAYVPIYAKHFTRAEIDEMIHFYRTPVGQKAVNALPAVVQDSMRVGQQWGQEVQPKFVAEVQRRLKAEGLAAGPTRPNAQ